MKRALAAGVIGMLGSKMGATAAGASAVKRPNMRDIAGERKKSILERILNMGPGPNKSSSPADVLGGISGFGLGPMDGAKTGKMIRAKKGTYVTANCKLGRNKKTIIT